MYINVIKHKRLIHSSKQTVATVTQNQHEREWIVMKNNFEGTLWKQEQIGNLILS